MSLFSALNRDAPRRGPSTSVLNPALYGALCAHYPYVRVLNPGIELEGYYLLDPTPQADGTARKRLKVVRWGETYLADCDFCGDTRGRLSISYLFGVKDEQTGTYGRELWKCYNTECQHDPERRRQLWERLSIRPWLGPTLRHAAPRLTGATELPPCDFPGELTAINALGEDHVAARYLRERRFDLDELATDWGIAVATHIPPRSRGSAAIGRIIIPVRMDGVMVGWQARYPADLNWKAAGFPKYLTFYPKSRALYGLDNASDREHWALFEGATDVWRYGPGGVSGFGKKLSPDQVRILTKRIGDRALTLVPDYNDPQSEGQFFESAARLREAGYRGAMAICPLPTGTDPATFDRATLQGMVAAAHRHAAI